MEPCVDPAKEADGQSLEIDPGLLLRKDHLSWLFRLIDALPMNPTNQSVNFCISCCRYLAPDEQAISHRHQHLQAPSSSSSQGSQHQQFPLILVQCRDNDLGGGNYYVSVQALQEIQVPIGDVLSHVLPYPHPRLLRVGVVGNNNLARCLYVHPQCPRDKMWQGETLSGRCAFQGCERIFNNRQSHLRLYGITPQFCSISCKIKSWLCCNS